MEMNWITLLDETRKAQLNATILEPGLRGRGDIARDMRIQVRIILRNIARVAIKKTREDLAPRKQEIIVDSQPVYLTAGDKRIQYYLVFADLFVCAKPPRAMTTFISDLETRYYGITERFVVEQDRLILVSLADLEQTTAALVSLGCSACTVNKDEFTLSHPETGIGKAVRELCRRMHKLNDEVLRKSYPVAETIYTVQWHFA